jgi:hypothetical protein
MSGFVPDMDQTRWQSALAFPGEAVVFTSASGQPGFDDRNGSLERWRLWRGEAVYWDPWPWRLFDALSCQPASVRDLVPVPTLTSRRVQIQVALHSEPPSRNRPVINPVPNSKTKKWIGTPGEVTVVMSRNHPNLDPVLRCASSDDLVNQGALRATSCGEAKPFQLLRSRDGNFLAQAVRDQWFTRRTRHVS